MNRQTLAIAVVAIIITLSLGALLYSNNAKNNSQNNTGNTDTQSSTPQPSPTQNNISKPSPQTTANIKITSFTTHMDWSNLVGTTMFLRLNITVQNIGVDFIDNATVIVQRIVDNSTISDDTICHIGYVIPDSFSLYPQQEKQVKIEFYTNLETFGQVKTANFLAKVVVDSVVLDEKLLY